MPSKCLSIFLAWVFPWFPAHSGPNSDAMRVKIIVQESYKTTQPVSLPFKEIAAYYLQLMGYAVSDSLHDAVLHISSEGKSLGAQYQEERTGTKKYYHTGASLSGQVVFEVPNRGRMAKSFSGKESVQEAITVSDRFPQPNVRGAFYAAFAAPGSFPTVLADILISMHPPERLMPAVLNYREPARSTGAREALRARGTDGLGVLLQALASPDCGDNARLHENLVSYLDNSCKGWRSSKTAKSMIPDLIRQQLTTYSGPGIAAERTLALIVDWQKSGEAVACIPMLTNALFIDGQDPALHEKITGRLIAVQILGKIGAPAVAPLVEKLKTADNPVRYHIIQALRNIGTAALDPVLPLARDRNPDLREHAVLLIAAIPSPQADPTLLDALADSVDRIRMLAIECLGLRKTGAAKEPLWAIVENNSRSEAERCAGLRAIGRLGESSMAPLSRILSDRMAGKALRMQAMEELWTLGARQEVVRVSTDQQEPALLRHFASALLYPQAASRDSGKKVNVPDYADSDIELIAGRIDHKSKEIRQWADDVLLMLGDRSIGPLLACLRESAETMRSTARRLLDKINGKWFETNAARKQIPDFIAALQSPNTWLRLEAIQVLGTAFKDTVAVPAIIRCLRDPDGLVRMRALAALGRMRDSRAVEAIISLLDREPELKIVGFSALANFDHPKSFTTLLAYVFDEKPALQEKALEALTGYRYTPFAESLAPKLAEAREILNTENHPHRWAAVRMAAIFKDTLAAPLVRKALLQDTSQTIKSAAVIALGLMGDRQSVDPLIAAMHNDARIKLVAIQALGLIGDQVALQPLLSELSRSRGEEKKAVIFALGRLRLAGAVEPLLAELSGEHHREVVEALVKIGDSRAIPALEQKLKKSIYISEQETIRSAIASLQARNK